MLCELKTCKMKTENMRKVSKTSMCLNMCRRELRDSQDALDVLKKAINILGK